MRSLYNDAVKSWSFEFPRIRLSPLAHQKYEFYSGLSTIRHSALDVCYRTRSPVRVEKTT